MSHLYYNRLKNNRIKGIALGVLAILMLGSFILYINTIDKKDIRVYYGLFFSILLMGVSYLLGQIPFGQILETTDNKDIITYYKLGGFKFNVKDLGRPKSVTIEQDLNKYYCLTLNMPDGKRSSLEKYSTLAEANERFSELKEIID